MPAKHPLKRTSNRNLEAKAAQHRFGVRARYRWTNQRRQDVGHATELDCPGVETANA
ncbi:MAG: hypothetical protein IV098_00275 [Thiobacillus sp.]|nr:hypothetical protein [Thiobacillus sp.]